MPRARSARAAYELHSRRDVRHRTIGRMPYDKMAHTALPGRSRTAMAAKARPAICSCLQSLHQRRRQHAKDDNPAGCFINLAERTRRRESEDCTTHGFRGDELPDAGSNTSITVSKFRLVSNAERRREIDIGPARREAADASGAQFEFARQITSQSSPSLSA